MFFWEAFIFGFIQGFVIGPLTLYGIQEGLQPRNGLWLQLQVTLGANIVNAFYLIVSTLGVSAVINHEWLRPVLWCGAAYLLISMGRHSLKDPTHKMSLQHAHRHQLHLFDSDFVKGFLLCLINPMAIVFAVMVVGSLYSSYAEEVNPVTFALNVNAGGLLTALVIIGLTYLIRQVFHPWMLKKLMIMGSYVLIGYGLWFSWKALLELEPMIMGVLTWST